ncbi:MAG: DedA family protein [Actinomycetota bacterium]|nr:MAG: DedA family protein [Actinomycetota bacterium]
MRFADQLALLPDWLDPIEIVSRYGSAAFWIAVLIILAECGIFIGFFLPGDSLLFVVGLLIAQGAIDINIWVAAAILSAAAVAGNLVGYGVGAWLGPHLFDRPDSRLFKRKHLDRAHAFFERYGAPAIILARFVPIVRTFITAVAGIARMNFKAYALYSAIGGVIWAAGFTILGYYLGNVAFIKNNIEVLTILIVLVSVIPIAIEMIRHRHDAPLLPEDAPLPADDALLAGPDGTAADAPGTGARDDTPTPGQVG